MAKKVSTKKVTKKRVKKNVDQGHNRIIERSLNMCLTSVDILFDTLLRDFLC